MSAPVGINSDRVAEVRHRGSPRREPFPQRRTAGFFCLPAPDFREISMTTTRFLAGGAVLAVLSVGGTQAMAQANADTGRFVAANCANCHGTHGIAQGAMPSLAGQKPEYIVEQMRAFRDGKRPATIMHQLAKGYSDAQIEAVAAFFARQPAAR